MNINKTFRHFKNTVEILIYKNNDLLTSPPFLFLESAIIDMARRPPITTNPLPAIHNKIQNRGKQLYVAVIF